MLSLMPFLLSDSFFKEALLTTLSNIVTIDPKKKIAAGSGGFEGARRPKFLRPQNRLNLKLF